MPIVTEIHGHHVRYEEEAHPGVHFIRHSLDGLECGELFKRAKSHSEGAHFEDHHNRRFVLQHHHDGTYTIEHQRY